MILESDLIRFFDVVVVISNFGDGRLQDLNLKISNRSVYPTGLRYSVPQYEGANLLSRTSVRDAAAVCMSAAMSAKGLVRLVSSSKSRTAT